MQIPLSLVSTLPQLQDSGNVKENCNAMGYKLWLGDKDKGEQQKVIAQPGLVWFQQMY